LDAIKELFVLMFNITRAMVVTGHRDTYYIATFRIYLQALEAIGCFAGGIQNNWNR